MTAFGTSHRSSRHHCLGPVWSGLSRVQRVPGYAGGSQTTLMPSQEGGSGVSAEAGPALMEPAGL